jgi:hypothetical protein
VLALAALGTAAWLILADDPGVLASVRGRALDATSGRPVAGARVVADGRTAKTRQNGAFTLSQITDGAPVTVSACGYERGETDADQTIAVRLVRQPVTGRATSDLTGAGVPATVRVRGRTSRANASGRFSLWGPCAGRQIELSAPGFRTIRVPVGREHVRAVLPALVARDDFAHGRGLFDSSASPSAQAMRKAGAYHVRVRVTSTPVGARQPIRAEVRLRDVGIRAAARRASGFADDSFGVFCRWRGARAYYLFEVSADGFARIEKHAAGRTTELRGWRPSNAIRPGSRTNRLSATCRGFPATVLKFAVNGATVATAHDGRGLQAGSVGVAVSGYKKPGTLVVFDDISVRRL